MSSETDRVKAGLTHFMRDLLAPTDYHALYPCTVVAQNADGTLELKSDNPRVAVPSRVPILLGLPGAAVKVAAGASVLLGFEGGSPSRPRAMFWGQSVINELSLNGGTVALAKADHTHDVTVTHPNSGSPALETVTTTASSSNTTLIRVP